MKTAHIVSCVGCVRDSPAEVEAGWGWGISDKQMQRDCGYSHFTLGWVILKIMISSRLLSIVSPPPWKTSNKNSFRNVPASLDSKINSGFILVVPWCSKTFADMKTPSNPLSVYFIHCPTCTHIMPLFYTIHTFLIWPFSYLKDEPTYDILKMILQLPSF